MTLIELSTHEELKSFLDKNIVGVVTFSAHWCGPCKASKPQLEALAKASNVPVSIVHESDIGDHLHTFNVRAFPTYVMFNGGVEVERVEGVNLEGVKKMIVAHVDKAGDSAITGGNTLGGSHNVAEARALRLAKLEASSTVGPLSTKKEAEETVPMEIEDAKPAAADAADATTTKDEGVTKDAAPAEKKKNPVDDLDKDAIKNLTEEMGFSLIRAQRGLLFSKGKTVESAIEWLMEHQDDADIDEPIPEGAGGVARSYRCKATGKILKSMADLELYANRTGHSDFEESTEAITPLTAEEKAAKILEIKSLLKAKRAEREEAEKVDNVEQEKRRRFMGKETGQTREQMDREQRKRDAKARKKEKMDEKRERERIRAMLEKDKRERMANKGKLKGRLGVDGYAPSAIQYGNGDDNENGEPAAQRPKTASSASSVAKIDEYISKVASYRAGGDGGKSLKVLKILVGNAADNPGEEKYKSISMETKTFKNKIKPFVGAKNLLLAVGFGLPEVKNDGTRLVLKDDADLELLKATKVKLEQAMVKYG